MNNIETLLDILLEVLDKKKKALTLILEMTNQQTEMIHKEKSESSAFSNVVKMKQTQIDQIKQMDEGFLSTYRRVQRILNHAPDLYKQQVQSLQLGIKAIGEIAIEIRVQEMRNLRFLEMSQAKNKAPKLEEGTSPGKVVSKRRIDAYTVYDKKKD